MPLNKTLIIGRLTRDPETRYTPVGMEICQFSIAVNRPKKHGEDEVSFFDLVAWDKTAKFIAEWFTKGKEILIEGSLKQDRWTDKETQGKRSKVVINVDRASFVGSKSDNDAQQAAAPPRQTQQPAQASATPSHAQAAAAAVDDDLPF